MADSNNLSGDTIFANQGIVKLNLTDVSSLKNFVGNNDRRSGRFCAHWSTEDQLQEMFIVHSADTYVRPHKHLSKSVSFHVIEGNADVVLFDESGGIQEVISVGEYSSTDRFYCRLPHSQYYTQLIRSDVFVFHETIMGPFDRSDTIWAPWSPELQDRENAALFIDQLVHAVDNLTNGSNDSQAKSTT